MIFISARQNIYKTNEFVREKLIFHPTPICPLGQAATASHYTSSRAFCHLKIPSPANRRKAVDSRRNLHDSAPRNLKSLFAEYLLRSCSNHCLQETLMYDAFLFHQITCLNFRLLCYLHTKIPPHRLVWLSCRMKSIPRYLTVADEKSFCGILPDINEPAHWYNSPQLSLCFTWLNFHLLRCRRSTMPPHRLPPSPCRLKTYPA